MKRKIQILSTVLICGLILNFANTKLSILLVIVAIAPLFVFLTKHSKKKSILIGFIYGVGIGLGMFFWMIKGMTHYTGNGILYGIVVYLVSSVFLGIYFSILSLSTKMICVQNFHSNRFMIYNRFAIAAIWTISEYVLSFLLESFPLHYFRIGFPFVTNVYSIQLASIGGLALLTFLTVLTNVFIADFYLLKKRVYVVYSLSILILIFVTGSIIFYNYTPEVVNKPFKVAIVSDNTNPETKWNDENGNTFANNYFKLCADALTIKPDFIIWPETAIPWTYSADDDLLKEIVKISSNQDLIHVIGINNENSINKKLYNSVFYIDKHHKVAGIYNKQVLLKGIEEPLGNFLVPFLNQEGFVLSKGENQKPIETRYGKAGNLICNEVVSERYGAEQVINGANFLFNFSNDGWFKDNYISDLHFNYARLQAVENRKDICIANNCGVNGIISSNGSIIAQKKDKVSTIVSGLIQPNKNLSFFNKYPLFFNILFILFILFYLIYLKPKTIRVDKQQPFKN